MPTLDDAPTISALLGDSLLSADVLANDKVSRLDLIQVYDVSLQKPRTITVKELGEAFGLTFV